MVGIIFLTILPTTILEPEKVLGEENTAIKTQLLRPTPVAILLGTILEPVEE
jgi:hypothetical protein